MQLKLAGFKTVFAAILVVFLAFLVLMIVLNLLILILPLALVFAIVWIILGSFRKKKKGRVLEIRLR